MRCGGCITGAIIAFALFMAGIFLAGEDTPWRDLLEDLHCKDYESWVQETTSDGGGEQNIEYYCTDVEEYRKRSMQGQMLVTSLGISFAVFLVWTLLTRLVYIVAPRPEPAPVAPPPVISFARSSASMSDWGEIESMLDQMGNALFEGGDTLTDRLRQLDEARQNELITDEEYARVRQAILDRMDD